MTVSRLAASGVRFAATSANSAGVVTELLVQPLKNVRRAPGKFYKSTAFVTFASGSLTYDLPLNPGAYAFAYRFVNPTTGQATGERLLGVVEV